MFVVLVAANAVVASHAQAQRVAGTVHETGSGALIAGAVVAALDSAGRTITRTISDEAGRYTVPWAPTAIQLRVVRIGYRPATAAPRRGVMLDTVDIAMERAAVLLDAVRISSDAVCGNSATARAALDLWEQARSALLATIVARESKPARVTTLTYERRYPRHDDRISGQTVKVASGLSTRPFGARPAALLASRGYIVRSTMGEMYYGPDADVLFDESFAEAHCFGVKVGDRDHPGQVGLTFSPRETVRRDSLVDVRGVLWLEPRGPSLVNLEFDYTGMNAGGVTAGGAVHFQSMPNGVAFIDEWSIGVPLLAATFSTNVGGDTTIKRVPIGSTESGGVVLESLWPDSTHWRTRNIGVLRGRVTERGSGGPAAGVDVAITGVTSTVTDTAGRFSFALVPRGHYGLSLTDSTFGQFLKPRTVQRDAVVGRGDTVNVNFEVESRASLIDGLCKGERATTRTAVLLGQIDDGTHDRAKDLRIEAIWQDDYAISTPGAPVAIKGTQQTIDVDDAGRFHTCGIVRDRPIHLRALIGRVAIADTVLPALPAPVRAVGWTVRPGLFTAAQLGDGSAFTGRVLRQGDGAPIADAEISVIGADATARTDSAGRFQLYGLPRGRAFIQLRRIGYAPVHDSITLRSREQTTRDFSLVAQVAQLDTVRSATGMVKYTSPRLQAFEVRRAEGMGRFISEAELRKNDNASLATLLPMRIPGIRLVGYKSASFAGNTRSAMGSDPTDTNSVTNGLADPDDKRSPRGCWVVVFVDGVRLYSGTPQVAPDMTRLPVSDYAGVEFYPSGTTIPPQFNSVHNVDCGVLLLWTRER